MRPLDPDLIEQVAKLMKKYKIEEYASEHFSLKMTHQAPKPRKPYTRRVQGEQTANEADEEFLDKYTVPPMDEEPWNNIDESVIERFSVNGKLGG